MRAFGRHARIQEAARGDDANRDKAAGGRARTKLDVSFGDFDPSAEAVKQQRATAATMESN